MGPSHFGRQLALSDLGGRAAYTSPARRKAGVGRFQYRRKAWFLKFLGAPAKPRKASAWGGPIVRRGLFSTNRQIRRERTRVVNLKGKGASLDFLGYTYRYDPDLYGRAQRYWNVIPSKKALQREREQLRAMTNVTQSHKPLARLIAELNRHLKGWGNYNLVRIPTGGLRADQQQRLFYHLRRQPATLPTAGRGELQRPMGPHRLQVVVLPQPCRPQRACGCMLPGGCGKSALPVRRGESGPSRSPGVTFSPPLPVRAVSRPPLDSVAGQPNEGEPRTPGIDDNQDPTPEGSGVFPHHPAGAPLVRAEGHVDRATRARRDRAAAVIGSSKAPRRQDAAHEERLV